LASDVFVHDRATGNTTLVSVSSSGVQGNGNSLYPSISIDGRYIAFQSDASNLVVGDTNNRSDIFVHDLVAKTTVRVSVNSKGEQTLIAGSYSPWISANGRYVTFESIADNLVDGDTKGWNDIFVRDLQTGSTTRVSVSSSGVEGNSDSSIPSISSDGRYVAFLSNANNLVIGDTNLADDIFVYDNLTGITSRVSVSSSGTQGNDDAGEYDLAISANGRYVAFYSYASNLVNGDTNDVRDVFVHDLMTGITTRVSVDSIGNQGNNISYYPSISADGRYVAFNSYANNLVINDTNTNGDGLSDVFIHDLVTGATTRVSVATNGTESNGGSGVGHSSLSADGRFVVFQSSATNLVNTDSNNIAFDIFIHETDAPSWQTFTDVSISYWAWDYIERLYNAGITGGCGTGIYCPDNSVTRAQMAIFLLKGIHGSSYAPPAVGGSTGFGDVATDYWAAAWIKQLAAEGITGGCGGGNYCPDNTVTRAQMAVFLLKAKNGSSYSPPAVGGSTGFGDVATDYWAAAFIKQLVADGITSGCGGGNYCPENPVTRAQMAVFLVKAFNLP
jgi:Tol biopolymer transport system component